MGQGRVGVWGLCLPPHCAWLLKAATGWAGSHLSVRPSLPTVLNSAERPSPGFPSAITLRFLFCTLLGAMRFLCCCSLVTVSCPTPCDPMDCSPQTPLSVGFSRQEYWSGLPFSSPGDLPDPGIEPGSPAWQADSLPLRHQGSPWFLC